MADKKTRPTIYEALLINGYEQNIYDLEIFTNYLDAPNSHYTWYNEKTSKKAQKYSYLGNYLVRYKPNVAVAPQIQSVIDEHINFFVKSEKLISTLSKYFNSDYLKKVFATSMYLEGGSIEQVKGLIPFNELETLTNKVLLDFAVHTKRVFERDEPVEIYLKVKNIQKLVCKVFEIDTLTYYTTNHKDLDETIDLDGLKPENTREFRFAFPKQKQHVHKIVLDEIRQKPQGLFIVEFTGGAKSCRMIIRKGILQVVPKAHFQGITYTIIDEKKRVCSEPGTGILYEGRFFEAGKDGQIIFPFSKEKVEGKQAIAVHHGFSYRVKLTIPNENYKIKTAVIFNEEGLVKDQVNPVIIRTKLYLNDTPITLQRVESCEAVAETCSFSQINNLKEWTNLRLDDASDLRLDIPTLKLLKTLRLSLKIKLTNLRGQPIVLEDFHEISIDRDHEKFKYCTVHLNKKEEKDGTQYLLELLGKNGEPISNHKMKVQFLKSFGMYDYEKILFTDQSGIANLGLIEDLRYILVTYGEESEVERLFVIPGPYQGIDIPNLIELCEGEKLILPSLGKRLSRENFEFVSIGKDPYNSYPDFIIDDCFDILKSEVTSITAAGLSKGTYLFRYNLHPLKEVKIVVHRGDRWGSNPYMLQTKRQLIELKPESRYLSINSIGADKDILRLKFSSNSLATARAHVLGYHYTPSLDSLVNAKLEDSNPRFKSLKIHLDYVTNSMLSNRELNDELKYVQQRSSHQTFAGNTLAKPSLLLHREKIRETKDDEEVIHQGRGFDKDNRKEAVSQPIMDEECDEMPQLNDARHRVQDMLERGQNLRALAECSESLKCESASFFKANKKESGGALDFIKGIFSSKPKKDFEGVDWSRKQRYSIRNKTDPNNFVINNNLDFAERSGLVLANIKPSASGDIEIDLKTVRDYGCVQVILADCNSTVISHIKLNSKAVVKRDLRVSNSLKPGHIWITDYRIHQGEKQGEKYVFEKEDLSGLETSILFDTKELFCSLVALGSNSFDVKNILEWSFLPQWNSFNDEHKIKHWEKFGGTELSIFTFFKDPEFWKVHVKPMLLCKANHSIEDLMLLAIDTKDARFLKDLPLWNDLANLSPLHMLLYCLIDPQLIDKCTAIMEGHISLHSLESLRLVVDSIISNVNSQVAFPVHPSIGQGTLQLGIGQNCPAGSQGGEVDDRSKTKKRQVLAADINLRGQITIEENQDEYELELGMVQDEVLDIPCEGVVEGLIPIRNEIQLKVLNEFKEAPCATEFKERQDYFKGEISRLPHKGFWLDLLKKVKERQDKSNLALIADCQESFFMANSTVEIIMALTFSNLENSKGKIFTQEQSSTRVSVACSTPFIVLMKSMRSEISEGNGDTELVISQKFYDPQDKLIFDASEMGTSSIKEVREFLPSKVYESRVCVTNLSDSAASVQLITQIPEGALPVGSLEDLKISTKLLPPMTTNFFTFNFYFPKVGNFNWYPATLTRKNKLASIAQHKGEKLTVVPGFSDSNRPMATVKDISSYGTADDLLKFLDSTNIYNPDLVDLDSIMWLCKEGVEAYWKLVAILKKKGVYSEAVWRYSIYYGIESLFKELIKNTTEKFLQKYEYINLPYGIELQRFEILEYDPLVNPRAHTLVTGQDEKGFSSIRNTDFRETYARFLTYCCEKIDLDGSDLVSLVGYWIAMDRIQEAINLKNKIVNKITGRGQTISIQFDYILAYLSIYEEAPDFNTARLLCRKYLQYPDLSWRERFEAIRDQLEEYDRGKILEKQSKDQTGSVRIKENKELAERTEYLKIDKTSSDEDPSRQAIQIVHKNITTLVIKFFRIDMEILFSKDPFMENQNAGICSVAPNYELKFRVNKTDFFKTVKIEIPDHLSTENLIVQASSKDKFDSVEIFNSNLHVSVLEEYGLVNVRDPDNADLHTSYVKCYAKFASNSEAKFFKDGYTDIRGNFDYCNTNSSKENLAKIEAFSVFVSHPQFGSTILKAKPPKPVSKLVQDSEDQSSYLEVYENYLSQNTRFKNLD